MAREIRILETDMSEFLAELEKHEIIWNKKHPLYAKTNNRENAIKSIADKLNISTKRVSKLNTYVKRKFNEQETKNENRSGDAASEPPDGSEWKWFESCRFLRPGICVRKNAPGSAFNRKSDILTQSQTPTGSVQRVLDFSRNSQESAFEEEEIEYLDEFLDDVRESEVNEEVSEKVPEVLEDPLCPNVPIPKFNEKSRPAVKRPFISSMQSPCKKRPRAFSKDFQDNMSLVAFTSTQTSEKCGPQQQQSARDGSLREILIDSVLSVVKINLQASNLSDNDLINFNSDVIRFILNYKK